MKRINWVEARKDCNLDLAFLSILDHVKHDVEAAANLPAEIRDQYEFHVEHNEDDVQDRIHVKGVTPPNTFRQTLDQDVIDVIFEKRKNSIHVFLDGQEIFTVVADWDSESSTCRYKVGKEFLDPWEISKKALEDVFFRRPQ